MNESDQRRGSTRTRLVLAVTGLGLAMTSGCLKVTTVNIGQKTSLERQLIGEFEPLTEEEVLASSVRAGVSGGSGALGDLTQRAVAARRRQLFNRDDIEEFKGSGCLGEAASAEMVAHPCEGTAAPEITARVERLIAEENEDRAAIIAWAIEADPVLTPSDRDQVVKVYAHLLRERAKPGHWYHDEEGGWSQRAAEKED